MGYNGGINKRGYYRRNHGMYKKSSYRSGEKILSGIIFGGLGLLATAASGASTPQGSSTRKKTKSVPDTYTPPPKPLSIEDSIINRMTSDRFSKIKGDYDSIIENNQLIDNQLSKLRYQVKWNRFLKSLFYLIAKFRLAFEHKIDHLNASIAQKEQEIVEPIININALLDDDLPESQLVNRGKIIMAFYNVSSETYLNEHKVLNVSELQENRFNYNNTAIVILKSRIIQLHLFHKGLVVMGKGTFGVVDYHDITSHYTTVYIKTRYAESELKVVRKTWLHAKANGDRDLRYSENYEINLVEYGCLKLNFSDNLTINILFSDATFGKELAKFFNLTPATETITIPPRIYTNQENKKDSIVSAIPKVYATTYNKATLTQTERELCDAIRRYGKPLNTRIAYKRPQIGSSVKRRSDGAILEVVNLSADQKFKCYDFAKDDCYLYTRDELMLS